MRVDTSVNCLDQLTSRGPFQFYVMWFLFPFPSSSSPLPFFLFPFSSSFPFPLAFFLSFSPCCLPVLFPLPSSFSPCLPPKTWSLPTEFSEHLYFRLRSSCLLKSFVPSSEIEDYFTCKSHIWPFSLEDEHCMPLSFISSEACARTNFTLHFLTFMRVTKPYFWMLMQTPRCGMHVEVYIICLDGICNSADHFSVPKQIQL